MDGAPTRAISPESDDAGLGYELYPLPQRERIRVRHRSPSSKKHRRQREKERSDDNALHCDMANLYEEVLKMRYQLSTITEQLATVPAVAERESTRVRHRSQSSNKHRSQTTSRQKKHSDDNGLQREMTNLLEEVLKMRCQLATTTEQLATVPPVADDSKSRRIDARVSWLDESICACA